MLALTIILNGDKVSGLETFYNQIDLLFARNESPSTGHNLEFFMSLLSGERGIYGYGQPVKLVWENFSYSRTKLGPILKDRLLEIIKELEHIEFIAMESLFDAKNGQPVNCY